MTIARGSAPRLAAIARLAAIGSIGVGMFGCAPTDRPFTSEHAAAVEDSVQTALVTFAELGAAGEWDRVAAMYADDPGFLWMEEGQVIYRSASEVASALDALTSGMTDSKLVWIEPSVVALAPGRAAMSAQFEQSFTTPDGGGFSYSGAMSAVMINGPGGWQFLRGHSSSGTGPGDR